MEERHIKVWMLHIAGGVTLFALIGFLISLGFAVIEYFLQGEDTLWYVFTSLVYDLPVSISAIIILYPLLCFLLQKIRMNKPNERDKIAYAILFFILIVSGGLIIIPAIIILSDFLGGEINLLTFGKSIYVILIGVATFYHYKMVQSGNTSKVGKGIVTAVVICLVAVSIYIVNPSTASQVKETNLTLERIENIRASIISNYQFDKESELPEEYDRIFKSNSRRENGAVVNYTKTSPTSYELCAEFEALPRFTDLPSYPYDFRVETIGENCFTFEVSR